jgi:hypothetical protein
VNGTNAVVIGGLANKALFFGGIGAETVSLASILNGSWNGDEARAVSSGAPWLILGDMSGSAVNRTGIFSSYGYSGGGITSSAHIGTPRTILSGY